MHVIRGGGPITPGQYADIVDRVKTSVTARVNAHKQAVGQIQLPKNPETLEFPLPEAQRERLEKDLACYVTQLCHRVHPYCVSENAISSVKCTITPDGTAQFSNIQVKASDFRLFLHALTLIEGAALGHSQFTHLPSAGPAPQINLPGGKDEPLASMGVKDLIAVLQTAEQQYKIIGAAKGKGATVTG